MLWASERKQRKHAHCVLVVKLVRASYGVRIAFTLWMKKYNKAQISTRILGQSLMLPAFLCNDPAPQTSLASLLVYCSAPNMTLYHVIDPRVRERFAYAVESDVYVCIRQ